MDDTWKGFASNTTLHGVRYIVETSGIRRMCWLVCLLAACGGFIYIVLDSMQNYISLPTNTIISSEVVSGIEFPDLTICNLNKISKSKTNIAYDDPRLKSMNLDLPACDVIRNISGNLTCGQALACSYSPIAKYYITNCNETMQTKLRQTLSTSSRVFNPEEFMYRYGNDFGKMLSTQYCLFKSSFTLANPCTVDDFDTVITGKGLCYTFNVSKFNNRTRGKTSMLRVSGAEYGLSVIINVGLDDYLIGDMSAGIRVIVGERGLGINPHRGFIVAPGSHALVTLKATKYERLPAPYASNCSQKYLPGYPIYSKDSCFFDCLIKKTIASCGCRLVGGQGYPDVPVCSVADEECKAAAEEDLRIANCYCNAPCKEEHYEVGMSTAAFPTEIGYNLLRNSLKINQTHDSLRKSFIYLQVGFAEIEYRTNKMQAAYGLSALLGDIGGTMGLLLGCSVMTLIEFFDIIFMTLYKKNKVRAHKNTLDMSIDEQSKHAHSNNQSIGLDDSGRITA